MHHTFWTAAEFGIFYIACFEKPNFDIFYEIICEEVETKDKKKSP